MDPFRWIAIPLSIVLGLGITRLLVAGVALFRSRRDAQVDWLPIAWAASIFLWQIQYWWAIEELAAMDGTWTFFEFLFLLSLPLLLFVSAALVLPPAGLSKGTTLAGSFEQDGRWALPVQSGYWLLAIFANWYFWDVSPFVYPELLNIVLAILPLATFRSPGRRWQMVFTICYLVVTVIAVMEMSPGSFD
jgi:hypothetical protein